MPAASNDELFHELAFYTLAHPDPSFIHQNAVDAFAAQTAGESTRNITIVFALIGLYLHLEKNFTGKQVQQAHMRMARYRREWPRTSLPAERGSIAIADVLAAAPGAERDAMIRNWCASVWEAWRESRPQIAALAESELGVR